MMIGGPVLSAILLLGALGLSTPVISTKILKDTHDVQRIKQQLAEKVKELFLKHLADEKRENGGENSVTRILFRRPNNISPRSTATTVTLSLPTLSAPPRSVRICLQGPRKCFNVNRDRSRAGADNTHCDYTLNLERTALLTEVRVQFHTKGFRTVPGLPPTLELMMGTESGRRAGVVLRQSDRSRRSKRDAPLGAPSPVWNQGLCRLHNWVVNTSLFGPDIQFVTPKELHVNYCAGQCTEGAEMTDNARARQRYRHRLPQASGAGPPPSVCVPIAYRSSEGIRLLIDEKVIDHTLERFTATGCACY